MNHFEDRFYGCLLGLAVGDAVGTTLEFKSPGSFCPIDDMVGGGPFRLKAGEWTDDTSMALCLAASLVEKQQFDPTDQLNRYCLWASKGYMSSNGHCFDIGNTVSRALDKYRRTGQPNSGSVDTFSAGNGSLMRLAPVPMFYADDAEKAVSFSGESSLTTHGCVECIDACRFFGGLLFSALHGAEKKELLSPMHTPLTYGAGGEQYCEQVVRVAEGSYKFKEPPEIRGTGYVIQSLEAALWAFYKSDDFGSGCLLAANLGEDADTTAAIYGQIAGAYYGVSGIPSEWIKRLAQKNVIENLVRQLAAGFRAFK